MENANACTMRIETCRYTIDYAILYAYLPAGLSLSDADSTVIDAVNNKMAEKLFPDKNVRVENIADLFIQHNAYGAQCFEIPRSPELRSKFQTVGDVYTAVAVYGVYVESSIVDRDEVKDAVCDRFESTPYKIDFALTTKNIDNLVKFATAVKMPCELDTSLYKEDGSWILRVQTANPDVLRYFHKATDFANIKYDWLETAKSEEYIPANAIEKLQLLA